MKKLTLALTAAILSLSTVVFAQEATVSTTGQIKFQGQIVESGCTLETGNSATINLGTMSVNNIQKKPSGWSHGQIKFLDCNLDTPTDKPLSGVELTIVSGFGADLTGTLGGVTITNPSETLWKNDGQAQNVGIQVEMSALNTQGQLVTMPILPTGSPEALEAKITNDNTAVYDVIGRMVGASAGVTTGSVETTITFNAVYK